MNTKTEINQEALTDEQLNEVVGGFNFFNFLAGHGSPQSAMPRAFGLTLAAFAAPGVIGSVGSSFVSAVSHLKFW